MTTNVVEPAWYPDPLARHEYRYWDGAGWTANVSDFGQAALDEAVPDSGSLGFRSEAAKALGLRRDPRAIPPLLAYLRDEDYGVRANAMRSLILIPGALDPLVSVLAGADPDVRRPAVEALWDVVRYGGLMHEPVVRAVIVGALKLSYFSGPPARAASAEFLSMLVQLGDPRTLQLMANERAGDGLDALEQMIARL